MATVSHPDPMAPLMTTDEVAAILRVSSRTVRRMGQHGTLERVHVGERLTRYTAESVEALVRPTNDRGAPWQAPRVTTQEGSEDSHDES